MQPATAEKKNKEHAAVVAGELCGDSTGTGSGTGTATAEKKNSKKQQRAAIQDGELSRGSTWGTVSGGRLAASGAPGKGALERCRSVGADTVVTLQRLGEGVMKSGGSFEEKCAAAGLEWVHLPLAGKKALIDPDDDDTRSLSAAAGVVPRLGDGASVVVHCSAGVMCYLAMRHAGLEPGAAMAMLHGMRPVTHDEMAIVPRGREVSLQDEAEQFFLAQLAPVTAASENRAGRRQRLHNEHAQPAEPELETPELARLGKYSLRA